jgi:hypothetical protein
MSFDWTQYFDVSRELAERAKGASFPHQEAQLRASISRAYYAVFGKARSYLRRHDRILEPSPLVGARGERINIHQYVREKFLANTDQDYQEIALILDRLSQYRNAADYDLNNPVLNNLPFTAAAVLKWAKDGLDRRQRLQKR